MFIEKTWQDYELSNNPVRFLVNAVQEYKASEWFRTACEAERYAQGNTEIIDRAKMKMTAYQAKREDGSIVRTGGLVEVKLNRVSTDILGRLVDQRIQYLLNNGINMDADAKTAAFGADADLMIEEAATNASIHGECYIMWDVDRMTVIPAASANGMSGMFFLLDEMSGAPMLGVRFWQLTDTKPWTMIVYTADGFATYRVKNRKAELIEEKSYITITRRDAISEETIGRGYGALPFSTLRGSRTGTSVFTWNIKSKIDVYDIITSDFADNLERMEGIYWAIKNFGGTADEAKAMLAELETLRAAVTQSDTMADSEMDAHPEAIEAPYAAREYALTMLRKAIHEDFMALDMEGFTGGSLTNVAIQTATTNLELACDKLETQVFAAMRTMLEINGHADAYADIAKFQRRRISNQLETVQMIYTTGIREDMTREKALEKTGLFEADELQDMLEALELEDVTGYDTEERMRRAIDSEGGDEE